MPDGIIPEVLATTCPNSGGNPLHQCAACTDHDKICKTISLLENVLAYVRAQELEARTRMNSSHGRLDNLPLEIASLIFEAAIEEGILPLFLGSICRMWRNLVWSTPSLWTDIDFILNPGSPKKPSEPVHMLSRRIALVDQIIPRSCEKPLTITIFKNPENDCVIPSQCLWPLLLTLRRSGPRLSTLSLQLPPELFRSLSDITAPNLRSLTLQTTQSFGIFPPHHFINLKPLTEHVQTLVIHSIHLDHIQISYKNLRHVKLNSCTQLFCITLLQEASELQSCVLHIIPSRFPIALSSQPMVKKDLKKLSLCYDDHLRLADFFPLFSFPVLEELILPKGNNKIGFQNIALEPLRAMLERSRCPLKQLQLPSDAWSIENLRELLFLVPTLTSLTLLDTLIPLSVAEVMATAFPHPLPTYHPKLDELVLSSKWTASDSTLGWKFLSHMFPLSAVAADSDGTTEQTTKRHYPTRVKITIKISSTEEEGDYFRLDDETASHIQSLQLMGCYITLDGEFVDGEVYRVNLMEMYHSERQDPIGCDCVDNLPCSQSICPFSLSTSVTS